MHYRSETAVHTASQWRHTRSERQAEVMDAILKVWRQIENPTPSVDAYLNLKNSPSDFIPIRFETTEP